MDQNSNNNNNNFQGGSIETGSFTSNPDQNQESSQYGDEVLRDIVERGEHALQKAERREYKPKPVAQPKQDDNQKQSDDNKKKSNIAKPKYFGYNISPKLFVNVAQVKKMAGKGDPDKSNSWINVLVDRMIKAKA